MSSGEAFVKWLRPAGCALFLVMAVLVTVTLFTAKGEPVDGYTAPETSEYYAGHLTELKAELEENLLPKLDVGEVELAVRGDVLTVAADAETLQTVRLAVIHYYDASLFEFAERK